MRRLASTVSLFLAVTVVRASCPTPTVYFSWQTGLGVQYHFPANNPPPCWVGESISGLGIADDINSAFARWSYANQAENGTNVGFYFSTTGPFRVNVQTVVDYSACGVSNPAWTIIGIYSGTSVIAHADTTFFLGSTNETRLS